MQGPGAHTFLASRTMTSFRRALHVQAADVHEARALSHHLAQAQISTAVRYQHYACSSWHMPSHAALLLRGMLRD